jgi:hypothetical protein
VHAVVPVLPLVPVPDALVPVLPVELEPAVEPAPDDEAPALLELLELLELEAAVECEPVLPVELLAVPGLGPQKPPVAT